MSSFDKQRAFGDIACRDSFFYVIVTNGDINKITLADDKIAFGKVNFLNTSKKVNEFESMYYPSDSNKKIILSKQCADDKKTHLSSFYFSDLAHQFVNYKTTVTEPSFEKIESKKEKIKPTAAINPITKKLYKLCSVNKLAFYQAPQGKIKDVIKLDPKIYKQTEGMTFTPEVNLILSNEVTFKVMEHCYF